jgi:hypothetical protein
MVRDYRIKEWRFQTFTPDSGTNASWKLVTSGPGDSEIGINGELLHIEYHTNCTGSLYLISSGTDELLWGNNAPSGASLSIAYPFVYGVNNVNTSISGTAFSAVTERVIHSPLFLGGSGADGGSVIHFVVHYR